MSRHIIKAQIAEKEAVVVIGFDCHLQHYHMVVQLDGDYVWSNLHLVSGGLSDVDPYIFVLQGFGIVLPDEMIDELMCDRLESPGTNKVKDWGFLGNPLLPPNPINNAETGNIVFGDALHKMLVAGWVIAPTSCGCGGFYAWLKPRESGAKEMFGCVCHSTERAMNDHCD